MACLLYIALRSASYKRAEDAHIVNRACMENFNKLYKFTYRSLVHGNPS